MALLTDPVDDLPADTRSVAVVLRLVCDRRGELVHGEIVDTEARLIGRFAEWAELVRILRDWLAA